MIRLEHSSVRRRVLIEIHSNICAANVYVSSKQYFALAKVEIHENYILVVFDPRGYTARTIKVVSPSSLFIPSSFHKLSGYLSALKNDESFVVADFYPKLLDFSGCCSYVASFRLEIKSSEVDNLSEYNSAAQHCVLPPLSTNVPYNISCNTCQSKLTDRAIVFKRVSDLDLNLLESSENWYCHTRSMCGIFQDANEIFVNDSSYSLKCLDNDYMLQDQNLDVIRCRKCRSVLSAVKHRFDNSAILCFKDKILLHSAEEPCHLLPDSNASLAVLLDIIENTLSTAVTCKLYLEAKVLSSSSINNCLLLWVMDHDHKKYKSAESKNEECIEELKFERVMKVLYFRTKGNNDIARSWIEEFSVDHHFVSDKLMDEVTNVLSESSEKVIKCDQNIFKMFSIGYLPSRKKNDSK